MLKWIFMHVEKRKCWNVKCLASLWKSCHVVVRWLDDWKFWQNVWCETLVTWWHNWFNWRIRRRRRIGYGRRFNDKIFIIRRQRRFVDNVRIIHIESKRRVCGVSGRRKSWGGEGRVLINYGHIVVHRTQFRWWWRSWEFKIVVIWINNDWRRFGFRCDTIKTICQRFNVWLNIFQFLSSWIEIKLFTHKEEKKEEKIHTN